MFYKNWGIQTETMDPLQRRALLFLLGCIPTRAAFTYAAAKSQTSSLPLFGALAALPAVGFLVIYFTGLRKTGAETGGAPIWWNNLRPLHALLWAAFAVFAIAGKPWAWMVLAADTLFGTMAFLTGSPASPFNWLGKK